MPLIRTKWRMGLVLLLPSLVRQWLVFHLKEQGVPQASAAASRKHDPISSVVNVNWVSRITRVMGWKTAQPCPSCRYHLTAAMFVHHKKVASQHWLHAPRELNEIRWFSITRGKYRWMCCHTLINSLPMWTASMYNFKPGVVVHQSAVPVSVQLIVLTFLWRRL